MPPVWEVFYGQNTLRTGLDEWIFVVLGEFYYQRTSSLYPIIIYLLSFFTTPQKTPCRLTTARRQSIFGGILYI